MPLLCARHCSRLCRCSGQPSRDLFPLSLSSAGTQTKTNQHINASGGAKCWKGSRAGPDQCFPFLPLTPPAPLTGIGPALLKFLSGSQVYWLPLASRSIHAVPSAQTSLPPTELLLRPQLLCPPLRGGLGEGTLSLRPHRCLLILPSVTLKLRSFGAGTGPCPQLCPSTARGVFRCSINRRCMGE